MKTLIAPLHLALLTAAFVIQHASFVHAQGGAITPTGAPGVLFKTLQEVEPRTAISTLPITISASGSYYLTGNLTALVSGNGITINASNVTLDLGGFELLGNGGAATFGIRVSVTRTNVTIRNGTVRNWPGSGVMVENTAVSGVRVEAMRALNNGSAGIALGIGCVAVDCLASGNVAHGISTGDDGLVLCCTARVNGGDGINVGSRCAVRECVATGNLGDGIQSVVGSTVQGCVVAGNILTGITVGTGSVVADSAATANTTIGIVVGSGSTVADCSATANTGTSGISLAANCTAIGCTVDANTSSAATSQGISAIGACLISRCTVSGTLSTSATFTSSTGAGIFAGSESVVEECVVRANKGDGIRGDLGNTLARNHCSGNGVGTGDGAGIHVINARNRIDGNHVEGNERGIDVDIAANTIVRNTAAANTVNYDIVAANSVGAIVNPADSVAINGNGSLASSLATTDPWANLSE